MFELSYIKGNTHHTDSADSQADNLKQPALYDVLRRIVFRQLLLKTLREIQRRFVLGRRTIGRRRSNSLVAQGRDVGWWESGDG
jgi:hypothetical protein